MLQCYNPRVGKGGGGGGGGPRMEVEGEGGIGVGNPGAEGVGYDERVGIGRLFQYS